MKGKFLTTYIVIISLLCQNVIWAYSQPNQFNSSRDKLAKDTLLDDPELISAWSTLAGILADRTHPRDADIIVIVESAVAEGEISKKLGDKIIKALSGKNELKKWIEKNRHRLSSATRLVFLSLFVDRRPVDNGLLDVPYVGHDMAVKRRINPDDKPLVGIYGGAGADVSNFLLSTNAGVGYFVDSCYRKEHKGTAKDVAAYKIHKYRRGYANEIHLWLVFFDALIEELKSIGVSGDDLERIRMMREGYNRGSGNITIEFMWAYPGQGPRKRTIHFVKGDISEPPSYPPLLEGALSDGIDFYYQRAGSGIDTRYVWFLEKIAGCIRPGGILVTENTLSKIDPFSYIVNAGMRKVGLTEEMEYWADFIRPDSGYGWNVKIYKKLENKGKRTDFVEGDPNMRRRCLREAVVRWWKYSVTGDWERFEREHDLEAEQKAVSAFNELTRDEDVLIAGPGKGIEEIEEMFKAAPNLRRLVVLDISRDNLDYIRQELARLPVEQRERVDIVEGDITKSSLESDRFKVVYSHSVINPDLLKPTEIDRAWEEVDRLLKDGDSFFLGHGIVPEHGKFPLQDIYSKQMKYTFSSDGRAEELNELVARKKVATGTPNTAVATQGMYTREQHKKMNERISSVVSGLTGLRVQDARLEVWDSLDEDTKKALEDVTLFLLPPEDPEYPYYLRAEGKEYQVAHAGTNRGEGKYVYMTRQAFMELPVELVGRILKREGRLAGERLSGNKAGDGYDDEVKRILIDINTKRIDGLTRDEIAVRYLPLVRSIARGIARRMPPYALADLEDLISWGTEGLLDAFSKYDISRGKSFGKYARGRIRGAMLDGLRSIDHLSRDERRKVKEGRLTAENVRLERILDWLPSGADSPLDSYTSQDTARIVRQAINRLPRRLRRIIRLYFYKGMTEEEIGRVCGGLTGGRISQLLKEARELLRDRLRVTLEEDLRSQTEMYYEDVLTGRRRKFPEGFWKGEKGRIRMAILVRYLFEKKLSLVMDEETKTIDKRLRDRNRQRKFLKSHGVSRWIYLFTKYGLWGMLNMVLYRRKGTFIESIEAAYTWAFDYDTPEGEHIHYHDFSRISRPKDRAKYMETAVRHVMERHWNLIDPKRRWFSRKLHPRNHNLIFKENGVNNWVALFRKEGIGSIFQEFGNSIAEVLRVYYPWVFDLSTAEERHIHEWEFHEESFWRGNKGKKKIEKAGRHVILGHLCLSCERNSIMKGVSKRILEKRGLGPNFFSVRFKGSLLQFLAICFPGMFPEENSFEACILYFIYTRMDWGQVPVKYQKWLVQMALISLGRDVTDFNALFFRERISIFGGKSLYGLISGRETKAFSKFKEKVLLNPLLPSFFDTFKKPGEEPVDTLYRVLREFGLSGNTAIAAKGNNYPAGGEGELDYGELFFYGDSVVIEAGNYNEIVSLSRQYADGEIERNVFIRELGKRITGDSQFKDFIVESLVEGLGQIMESPDKKILIQLLFQGIFGNRDNDGNIIIRRAKNLPRNSSRYYAGGVVIVVFNSGFIDAIRVNLDRRKAGWLFCERLFHELYHKNTSRDSKSEEERVTLNCDLILYERIGQRIITEEDLQWIKYSLQSGRYFRYLQFLLKRRPVPPPPSRGPLDGYAILRYADGYDSIGGLEVYLQELNRSLLVRSNVTIIQMYITYDEDNSSVTEERIGRGRLVKVPILVKKKDSKAAGMESRFYDILKVLFERIGIKMFLRDLLYKTRFGEVLSRIPLIREFYNRRFMGLDREEVNRKTEEIFERYKIDLAMFHSLFTSYSLGLVEMVKRRRIPVLVQNHGENNLFESYIGKRVISLADGVSGVNSVDVPGHIKSRFVNLSDGIDTEFFKLEKARPLNLGFSEPVILLPARIEPDKGHLDLLKIAKILRDRYGQRVKIIFAGPEGLKGFIDDIKRLAKKYSLSDAIFFTGSLSQEDLRNLYAVSSVVVLPSRTEGLGRVLLEAQAMRKPVVAYNVGGVPEAICDCWSGSLIRSGDLKGFAMQLASLLNTVDRIGPMREQARRFVEERFSLKVLAERHEKFYMGVLGSTNSAVATAGMYTREQHGKTNERIRGVVSGLTVRWTPKSHTDSFGGVRVQDVRPEVWDSLDDEAKKALEEVTLFLLPPEDPAYPYYLRVEDKEYQVAHAGSNRGEGRYVYMTEQAFMELPVELVGRILRREARLAGERFSGRRDGGGYDDEVKVIFIGIAKAVDSAGRCVTGDTLLPITGVTSNHAKGRPETRKTILKPIVDVKSGDYVLSLNEETQIIEPHRIKGLLDMGTKPVYRLTTASGRSIKTTANHPYLTRRGWVKVSGLREGSEIAIPNYFLTRKSVSSTTNSFLLNALNDENLESRFFIAVISFLAEGGCILRRIIPQYLHGGYINILEKCTSLVINILFSLDASFITSPFLAPLCILLISWPCAIRYSATSRLIFSSIRNFILRFDYKRAILLSLNHFGSKMEGGLDTLFIKRRITSDDLFRGISSLKKFQGQVHHYTGPLKTGLSMADVGICGNVIFNSHSDSSFSLQEKFYQSLRGMSSLVMPELEAKELGNDVIWDRIVAIEYLGYEHVYDIEVEGTHNFIGNGIFAHNTYIDKAKVNNPLSKALGGSGNVAIATAGMYTPEQHEKTNRRIRSVVSGLTGLRVQDARPEVWDSLDEDTKKALEDVMLFLLPPEDSEYPYYLRVEGKEFQVAHAGTNQGQGRYIYMTEQAFMELPVELVGRILRREARLIGKRGIANYDEEVEAILLDLDIEGLQWSDKNGGRILLLALVKRYNANLTLIRQKLGSRYHITVGTEALREWIYKDPALAPIANRLRKLSDRFHSFWDVIRALQERARQGQENTINALRKGTHKDWPLYFAVKHFGVELPVYAEKYPTRHAVLEGLEERRRQRLTNDWETLKRKREDPELYRSAVRFGVFVPYKARVKVMQDVRLGFAEKEFYLAPELLGKVYIERGVNEVRLVDIKDPSNWLSFLLKKGKVYAGEERLSLKKGREQHIEANPAVIEFVYEVLKRFYGKGKKEAILTYLKAQGIQVALDSRLLVMHRLWISLPRLYEESPGVVTAYRERDKFIRFYALVQTSDPDNYIIFVYKGGDVYIVEDDDIKLEKIGRRVSPLKVDQFKAFDLRITRPKKELIREGSTVASLGQASIGFSSQNVFLIERRRGTIYRQEEWARDKIILKDPDTEEVVTEIERVGYDEFRIDGIADSSGSPVLVKTDRINLSTLIWDFPEFSSRRLKNYFARTDENSFGGPERIVKYRYDSRSKMIIRKGYKASRHIYDRLPMQYRALISRNLLSKIISDNRLPGEWPRLQGLVGRGDAERNAEIVAGIGRAVEEAGKGRKIKDKVKALIIEAIAVQYFNITESIRIELHNLGYGIRADEIAGIFAEVREREREFSRADYYFMLRLEELLGYPKGTISFRATVSELNGESEKRIRDLKDIFKLNLEQWELLDLARDTPPKGVIVQDIEDLGPGAQNWLSGLKRYNIDMNGVEMVYIVTEEDRRRLSGVILPNVRLVNSIEEVEGMNIVYLANEDELRKVKKKGVVLVKREFGPVIDLSLCLLLLGTDDGEETRRVFRDEIERIGILPKIEKVLQMWDELGEGADYLDVWA